MFCSKCGKPISGGAKFCPYCGRGASSPTSNPFSSGRTDGVYGSFGSNPKPKGRSPWLIIGICAAVIALGVTALAFLGGTPTPQARIEAVLQEDGFFQKPLDLQQAAVSSLLSDMYQDGQLLQPASFDPNHQLYSFQYDDGTYSGISLQTFDDSINSGTGSAVLPDQSLLSSHTGSGLDVIVFNGFEDTPFRTDYYVDLENQWEAAGISTTVDTYVTVSDFEALTPYDVVVFSMHGSIYNQSPVLCLNEIASSSGDKQYANYLHSGAIVKVYTTDGAWHYWVFPEMFTQCYSPNAFDGKVFWSESCCFFGSDDSSGAPDTAFANALLSLSCETVMGYRNSVLAVYSRNVMKHSLDAIFSGTATQASLESAAATFGYDDGSSEAAYPVLCGDSFYVLTRQEASPTTEATEPTEATTAPTQAYNPLSDTYWLWSKGSAAGMTSIVHFKADGSYESIHTGTLALTQGQYYCSNNFLIIDTNEFYDLATDGSFLSSYEYPGASAGEKIRYRLMPTYQGLWDDHFALHMALICYGTDGQPGSHQWVAATCTEAKHCTRCFATEGAPLGHNYVYGNAPDICYCTRCSHHLDPNSPDYPWPQGAEHLAPGYTGPMPWD